MVLVNYFFHHVSLTFIYLNFTQVCFPLGSIPLVATTISYLKVTHHFLGDHGAKPVYPQAQSHRAHDSGVATFVFDYCNS